jgi:hypothetical protein
MTLMNDLVSDLRFTLRLFRNNISFSLPRIFLKESAARGVRTPRVNQRNEHEAREA